jgi:hypothetical protein
MKIITPTLLFALLLTSTLYAQDANEMLMQSAFSELQSAGSMGSETLPYYTFNKGKMGTVKGSAMLDDSWQDGIIMSLTDQLYQAKMRYNAIDDEVEVWEEDGKSKSLPPEKVKGVRIGDQIFVAYPVALGKNKGIKSSYLEVLVEGEASLYKRHYAQVEQIYEVHPTQGRIPTGDSRVEHKSDYYYAVKDRPAARLKTNKSSVMDVLSRRRKAVARFAKENELSPKEEKDLIALFQFYNRKK